MREKSDRPGAGEQHVRDIRRATRRKYSSEEKIRIVVSGLRGEYSIAELCRREGIAEGLYYNWSKEFLGIGQEAAGWRHTAARASSSEVKDLRREARDLKEVVAELTLENRLLKKSRSGMGRPRMRYPACEKLEIIRICRAVPFAGEADAGQDWRIAADFLPMV
jgi:transposase-like protein